MPRSTTLRLRGLWFQVHKWIGLSLAILIIPISLSGAALVWHDWLDETINPQRYAVTRRGRARPRRLCRVRPGRARRRATGSPRSAIPSRPRPGDRRRRAAGRRDVPLRTNVWLDPASGRVLDQRLGRRRPGPLHPRPPRQPRRARLGPDDRRLGRHLHVLLLPDRPLAVVADHRQRQARLSLEAAEFDQRQPPPSGRLLGAAAAGDAELHRRLDLLPGLFGASRRRSPRRRPTAPARARQPLERTALTADRGARRRRGRSRPAPSSASPGRPTSRRMEDRLRARGRPGRSRGRRRHRRSHAAAPAAARDQRPADAPPPRRHRHGPGLADRSSSSAASSRRSSP